MKQFLYLVQSRQKLLDNHRILESENSDYVVLTFEEKVDRENFLYLPNSVWEEGRNALIEHARNLPQKYEYYVLLDDDISFIKGSFREFEKEVLLSQPDFTTPVYRTKKYARLYYSLVSKYFKYSQFIQIDCCFVCFSQRLFFSDILPYETIHSTDSKYRGSWYSSFFFWIRLFEHNTSRKFVLNAIKIDNTISDTPYKLNIFYSLLKRANKIEYKYTASKFFSMPVFAIIEILLSDIWLIVKKVRILRGIVGKGIHYFLLFIFTIMLPIFIIKNIILNKSIIQLTQKNRV